MRADISTPTLDGDDDIEVGKASNSGRERYKTLNKSSTDMNSSSGPMHIKDKYYIDKILENSMERIDWASDDNDSNRSKGDTLKALTNL
jgi:hypothetical protein